MALLVPLVQRIENKAKKGPLNGGFCSFCTSRAGNSFAIDPNPNSFNDSPSVFTHPPQLQFETYLCELCGNNTHYGYDCPPLFSLHAQPEDIQELLDKLLKDLQIISEELAEFINSPSWNRPTFYDDDDDEYTIIYRSTKAITHNLPTKEPEDSLIMGDEHLSIIPEKESDEFIKSSIEDLVPIPSESEDTSDNESKCDVLVYDDCSPLDVLEDNPVIFSNPLFDSNEDFTSSDDESLSEEDVPKETFKIYSNPLFEFDDDFTSSEVNPLFNEDKCFDPGGDEIDAFQDLDISTEIENDFHDSEGDIIFLEKLLINNTFPILPSEGFMRKVDSPFLLSSGSEDTIFYPGISAFHFSSLKPVAYKNPMVILPFFCFCPKDKGIRGEIPQDHEDPCTKDGKQSKNGLRFRVQSNHWCTRFDRFEILEGHMAQGDCGSEIDSCK
ncbi:hypothetical protein Tco_0803145 [Tanacetum coccineum]|uniref:Uncharacterized protein n=1 Tax=Tanacetum coccineum TaxID=301880 RepID=A0ABQ5A4V7_9ASTR